MTKYEREDKLIDSERKRITKNCTTCNQLV